MHSSNPDCVVALCGPSGVGKGFVKRRVQEEMPAVGFIEPVVATTRKPRNDDNASRMAGLDELDFNQRVLSGSLVLPHRPFRMPHSPLYAFQGESLGRRPLLTEVHSTIVGDFRELLADNTRVLIVGFVAASSLLSESIGVRQGTFHDGVSASDRVALAGTECDEISAAHHAGSIDHVLAVREASERDEVQTTAVNIIRTFMETNS
jgi:hypothetical protein